MLERTIFRISLVYVLIALGTRLAEAMGAVRCGCADTCWCHRPLLRTFRWVLPYRHEGPAAA